jgi:predicted membrane protein
MFAVMSLCVLVSALVGRWWTLAMPLVIAGAMLAAMPIDSYYERTPEDVQAGVVLGAAYGLALAAVALLVRHYLGSWGERRRNVRGERRVRPER